MIFWSYDVTKHKAYCILLDSCKKANWNYSFYNESQKRQDVQMRKIMIYHSLLYQRDHYNYLHGLLALEIGLCGRWWASCSNECNFMQCSDSKRAVIKNTDMSLWHLSEISCLDRKDTFIGWTIKAGALKSTWNGFTNHLLSKYDIFNEGKKVGEDLIYIHHWLGVKSKFYVLEWHQLEGI